MRRAVRRAGGRPGGGLVARPGALLGGTFSAFGLPGFAGAWVSASAGAFARTVAQVTLGWLALETTGSPLMVGVVLAARSAPQLLLGLPAGALSDYFERRRLIVTISGVVALTSFIFGLVSALGALSFPLVVAAALLLGSLETLRTTATQAYVFDLVRAARAANGLALANMGGHLFGILAGLAAGGALERYGGAAAFGLVALATAIGAGSLLPGRSLVSAREARTRPRPDLARAARLLLRERLIAVLALTVLVGEVFGFSFQTLLPTFARDVFEIGAGGLGVLISTRSIGAVLGLLLLARLGTGDRSGPALLGLTGGFGLALASFAQSPTFGLALPLMLVVGAFGSAVDSLGQTLLQRTVADRERGAAMGIWVFSIGFAPFGHLALGATAGLLGAPLALSASGLTLGLVSLALGLHAPLRRLR